jgi:hypothetical protein
MKCLDENPEYEFQLSRLLKGFRIFLRLMRSFAGNAAATMLGIDLTQLIGAKVSTRSRFITSA